MLQADATGQRDQPWRKSSPSQAPPLERARAARRAAQIQRAHAVRSRETARRQRQESIRLKWRARRLFFDRHGPVLAMWPETEPSGPDIRPLNPLAPPDLVAQPDPVAQPDNADSIALASMAIERLFGVGLTLASCRVMIGDGVASDRVDKAMDDIDVLIRDLRAAVFADHKRDADSARSELRQSLPHLIDLANIAQADSFSTADHLNLSHTLQRALLELDWITE